MKGQVWSMHRYSQYCEEEPSSRSARVIGDPVSRQTNKTGRRGESPHPCTHMSCSTCWVLCWWMKSARAGGTSRSSGRSCGRSRLSFERAGDRAATNTITQEAHTSMPSSLGGGGKEGGGKTTPSYTLCQTEGLKGSDIAPLTLREGLLSIGLDKDFREKWCIGIINLLSESELGSEDVFCV